MLMSVSKEQLDIIIDSTKFKLNYLKNRYTDEDIKTMELKKVLSINDEIYKLLLTIDLLEHVKGK